MFFSVNNLMPPLIITSHIKISKSLLDWRQILQIIISVLKCIIFISLPLSSAGQPQWNWGDRNANLINTLIYMWFWYSLPYITQIVWHGENNLIHYDRALVATSSVVLQLLCQIQIKLNYLLFCWFIRIDVSQLFTYIHTILRTTLIPNSVHHFLTSFMLAQSITSTLVCKYQNLASMLLLFKRWYCSMIEEWYWR